MFGYVNNLRSMSQGRAQYTIQFSHYEKVPQNVQDKYKEKQDNQMDQQHIRIRLQAYIIKY